MKKYKLLSCSILVLVLVGCASKADKIAPTYVSPVQYENYTCDQLSREAQNVSQQAAVASGQQDKQASQDKVTTGVGLVVFWPALLFNNRNGQNAAYLANLKGQMIAIEQASVKKNCNIQFKK